VVRPLECGLPAQMLALAPMWMPPPLSRRQFWFDGAVPSDLAVPATIEPQPGENPDSGSEVQPRRHGGRTTGAHARMENRRPAGCRDREARQTVCWRRVILFHFFAGGKDDGAQAGETASGEKLRLTVGTVSASRL